MSETLDVLTGLLGTDAVSAECGKAIEAANSGEGVAVAYVAFDGLRELSDRSGNLVTDQLLRELGTRLRGSLRDHDAAGHLSRDEFLIVLRQLGGRLETLAIVSRLRITLSEPIRSGKGTYRPVVNIGLAYPPADGNTREALTKVAEKAMLVMREQAREAARRDATQRVISTRAAVSAATANVSAAEQVVRDADNNLIDSKKLLAEAKAAVVEALDVAKRLGLTVP